MHLVNPPSGPLCRQATCDASVSVGDVVSTTAPDIGGVWRVEVTDPEAATFRAAIGIVKRKPTATTCIVQASGVLNVLTGLTTGQFYYAGTDSKIAAIGDANFPQPATGVRRVQQLIGIAASDDQLLVLPSTPTVPRHYWQALTGTINGSNLVFTTSLKFESGTPNRETVKFNGLEKCEGVGGDYTATESVPGTGYDTITFAVPPRAGDVLSIDFQPVF